MQDLPHHALEGSRICLRLATQYLIEGRNCELLRPEDIAPAALCDAGSALRRVSDGSDLDLGGPGKKRTSAAKRTAPPRPGAVAR